MGACSALRADDRITSSHRGHGDAIAKGFAAIRQMADERARARGSDAPATTRAHLLAAALEDHVYRTIAELFGKEDGYSRGRGGGMHIARLLDRPPRARTPSSAASVPIATGAAMALRYQRSDRGRVLLRGGRRLCQRRRPRVAQLGRPAPVDQPPRRATGRSACRSSSSSRTTTTA